MGRDRGRLWRRCGGLLGAVSKRKTQNMETEYHLEICMTIVNIDWGPKVFKWFC
jgi:hypothetical protein